MITSSEGEVVSANVGSCDGATERDTVGNVEGGIGALVKVAFVGKNEGELEDIDSTTVGIDVTTSSVGLIVGISVGSLTTGFDDGNIDGVTDGHLLGARIVG